MSNLELRQYKNDSAESKNFLVLKLRAFFLTMWLTKKRDNFKTRKFFDWVESFLYCVSSNLFFNQFNQSFRWHSLTKTKEILWISKIRNMSGLYLNGVDPVLPMGVSGSMLHPVGVLICWIYGMEPFWGRLFQKSPRGFSTLFANLMRQMNMYFITTVVEKLWEFSEFLTEQWLQTTGKLHCDIAFRWM